MATLKYIVNNLDLANVSLNSMYNLTDLLDLLNIKSPEIIQGIILIPQDETKFIDIFTPQEELQKKWESYKLAFTNAEICIRVSFDSWQYF